MARYKDAVCRLCRRQGMKLFLKGTKCFTDKCPFERRGYAPGQHGKSTVKLSNYGIQLREKQKVKRLYGVLERQFRRYFHIAERAKGITGAKLLELLERRLDNVIFRLGFATNRAGARQIIRYGHILVNKRKVNIPSYSVKVGDIVSIKPKETSIKFIKQNMELMKEYPVPSWLELNKESLEGKVLRLPEREDVGFPIQEQLIVELYSK